VIDSEWTENRFKNYTENSQGNIAKLSRETWSVFVLHWTKPEVITMFAEGPLPRSMKATLGDRQEPEGQAWRDVCIKRRNRAALRTRFPLTPDVGDGWFKPGW